MREGKTQKNFCLFALSSAVKPFSKHDLLRMNKKKSILENKACQQWRLFI